jgi:hypothetical protein
MNSEDEDMEPPNKFLPYIDLANEPVWDDEINDPSLKLLVGKFGAEFDNPLLTICSHSNGPNIDG